jgi:2-haloacid dehalogenase
MNLARFRVFTFDCYGTLIDWEAGILAALGPWLRGAGIDGDERALLEAFAEAESAVQQESPRALYPEILRQVQARMAEHFGVPPDLAAAEVLASSVGDWPPFADTRAALERLQRRHKLVIVSNVDRASFARSERQMGIAFDAVVTAEEVGAYKPDLRMFRRALDVAAGLGAAPDEVLHVAQSLFHDHLPAKQLRLTTVWVRRASPRAGLGATRDPGRPVWPDAVISTLTQLAEMDEEANAASG